MNAISITAASLHAALAEIEAIGRIQGTHAYAGGIGALRALFAPAAAPASPIAAIADQVQRGFEREDMLRAAPLAEMSIAVMEQEGARERAQAAGEGWMLPDGSRVSASLDDLLPDEPYFAPRRILDMRDGSALWIVCASLNGHGEANVADHEWHGFDTKADALAYCNMFQIPADTTAEPTASLVPAPAEDAPPPDASAAPLPPPPAAMAEGDFVEHAEVGDAPPGDAPSKPATGRTSPAWPPARVALLRDRYPHEGSTEDLRTARNAIPAASAIETTKAVTARAGALGIRVTDEARNRILDANAAKARATQAAKAAAATAAPAASPPPLPAPAPPTEQPPARPPLGPVAIPATLTPAEQVKQEAFAAFSAGLSVRDIAADFGEPVATISAWQHEWRLQQKQQGASA